MSTPLSSEKVNEIRDIFDNQQRKTEKTLPPAMNLEERLREKEAILTRLAQAKEKLDTRINTASTMSAPKPVPVDHNQTVEVPAVDATWMQSSDESFLRWEQDCDKTMLPSNSQQPQGPAKVVDPELAAIDRLMKEYNLDQRPAGDDHDQTQLEDVEPPSGIWDTTVMAAKMTSPVKMMHAVRPSTIIEEDSLGSVSMASSYKTAASALSKVAPSERYDTATETICLSSDQSSSNVIEILDDDSLETKRKAAMSSGSVNDSDAANSVVSVPQGNATLDGISSLMPDSSSSSGSERGDSGDFSLPMSKDSLLEDTPDFNDTLERIEFMEKQGMKLLQQQKATAIITPNKHAAISSPKPTTTTTTKPLTPKTPGLGKTLLPSTSTKPRTFYPSPSALNSNSSPGAAFKKPGNVRSPQVKFVPPKRNFDHIVSPIATYIKDVPTQTFYSKYKGQTLFSNNSPIKKSSNTPTKEDTKENKQSQLKPPQWQIPRKVFTSTNHRHEIDNRQPTKIPGGFKVHQMVQPAVGNPNKIIRHEGRVQMDLHQSRSQPRDSIFDETLANMSVVSGDVSIQVIQDMKKH